jgi:hypothetical protein
MMMDDLRSQKNFDLAKLASKYPKKMTNLFICKSPFNQFPSSLKLMGEICLHFPYFLVSFSMFIFGGILINIVNGKYDNVIK